MSWRLVVGGSALGAGAGLLAFSELGRATVPGRPGDRPDDLVPLSRALSRLKPAYRKLPRDENYISRAVPESALRSVVSDPTGRRDDAYYHIVYGSTGAGLSSVLTRVLDGQPGVLRISLSSETIKDDVAARICRIAGVKPLESLDVHEVAMALGQARELRGGKPMVVVLEVGYASADKSWELLYKTLGLATNLAYESNVLVVLNDASTVMNFPGDSRATFIEIGEMTRAEARTLVESRIPGRLDEDELDRVVASIGTLPLTLNLLCGCMDEKSHPGKTGGAGVEDCIAANLSFCETGLKSFSHKPLLRALRDSPSGSVRPGAFEYDKVREAVLACPGVVTRSLCSGLHLASQGLVTVNKNKGTDKVG